MVSEIFDPNVWDVVPDFDFTDITYHRAKAHGTVRIAFNRPEVRNAFRPNTVDELFQALEHARCTSDVGCVLLTGNGPSPKDAGWAFCSGGDQRIRGKDGYKYEGDQALEVDPGRLGRLHILEVQRLIRFMPKIVIAVVPGWAVGGGHSLHVVCDLTLASKEHAVFKQTDPDVASFDSGYGSALLARQCGQKRAREIFSFWVIIILLMRQSRWAWPISPFRTLSLKRSHWNGRRPSTAKVLPRCGCLSMASTFRMKAWLDNSSLLGKRPAWLMELTKRKKVAMHSWKSVRRTTASFLGITKLRRTLLKPIEECGQCLTGGGFPPGTASSFGR